MIDVIKRRMCKECGQEIDFNLCSYECKYDNEVITARPKESIEAHVYKYTHTEELEFNVNVR